MSLSTKWPSLSDDAAYIWSWDFVSSATRTTRADFSGLPSAAATTRPVTVHRAAAGFSFALLSEGAELCARSAVARARTAGVKKNCLIGNSQRVKLGGQNYTVPTSAQALASLSAPDDYRIAPIVYSQNGNYSSAALNGCSNDDAGSL